MIDFSRPFFSLLGLFCATQLTLQCAAADPPSGSPATGRDASSGSGAAPGESLSAGWTTVATYQDPSLGEISGLAPSLLTPGTLWAHNDSGGSASIHALNLQGDFLGSVKVKGARNVDWEDIASFLYRRETYLLIADTGDNEQRRATHTLYIIKEPRTQDGTHFPQEAEVAWTLSVRYEDGPQDCEAAAVLPEENRILLLNKNAETSVIYEVPLVPPSGTLLPQTAKKWITLPDVANASGNLLALLKAGLLGSRATALDIAPNNRVAAVLTYTDVRLFRRGDGESWSQALVRDPRVVALPSVYQPEALCFSHDNRALYVSSEESPTPLLQYVLPPAP